VTLAAYPGQVLRGKTARVSPMLEPDTRRAKVRIPFDNADGRLRPNMFATATFAAADADGVTVPPSALLMNNDSTTVLVEVAPWTFVRRVVEIGAEDERSVQVVSGLKRGDRVVVRGGVLLND
jgi:cobalt-zinc-cadmium efflux system membrane fusion protein